MSILHRAMRTTHSINESESDVASYFLSSDSCPPFLTVAYGFDVIYSTIYIPAFKLPCVAVQSGLNGVARLMN